MEELVGLIDMIVQLLVPPLSIVGVGYGNYFTLYLVFDFESKRMPN